MAHSIRITVTPDMEKALGILRQSTTGTLNTSELIKLAVGELAQLKKVKMDKISARLFYEWAKEEGTLEVDNIAHPEKIKLSTGLRPWY